MVRADTIELISESPEAHGVFETIQEERRTVLCEVKSVGMNEFYTALSQGITPSVVFELSDYSEYQGEKLLVWQGKRLRVTRTYVTNMKIEIIAEEVDVNG